MAARSNRITKKFHSIWFIEAISQIVMDREIEDQLWAMAQDDIKNFSKSNYFGSEILSSKDLNINVIRGPIENYWLYKEFDPKELNLYFYATNFPRIAHGWTLYEEDKST